MARRVAITNNGNLTLVVGGEVPSARVHEFRVQSQRLAQGSAFFRNLLTGPWAESQSSQTTDEWRVSLPTDRPEPMECLLNALHGNINHVPVVLNVRQLCQLAELCNKFVITGAFARWARGWINSVFPLSRQWSDEESPRVNGDELRMLFFIAWEFGSEPLFTACLDAFYLHSGREHDNGMLGLHGHVEFTSQLELPEDVCEAIESLIGHEREQVALAYFSLLKYAVAAMRQTTESGPINHPWLAPNPESLPQDPDGDTSQWRPQLRQWAWNCIGPQRTALEAAIGRLNLSNHIFRDETPGGSAWHRSILVLHEKAGGFNLPTCRQCYVHGSGWLRPFCAYMSQLRDNLQYYAPLRFGGVPAPVRALVDARVQVSRTDLLARVRRKGFQSGLV